MLYIFVYTVKKRYQLCQDTYKFLPIIIRFRQDKFVFKPRQGHNFLFANIYVYIYIYIYIYTYTCIFIYMYVCIHYIYVSSLSMYIYMYPLHATTTHFFLVDITGQFLLWFSSIVKKKHHLSNKIVILASK